MKYMASCRIFHTERSRSVKKTPLELGSKMQGLGGITFRKPYLNQFLRLP